MEQYATAKTSNSNNNAARNYVSSGVGGGKEAVLKRLLETQETYIIELESKCKALTDQITDTPMKVKAQTSAKSDLAIDLVSFEHMQASFVDKLANLVSFIEATNSNDTSLVGAINIIRSSAMIEMEVF